MSGATNRSALLNTGLGVPVELCPDAPGNNDLSPGTWTRRHRSQVVSDRNLVKSNSKEDVSDQYAGLGSGEYGHPIRRISGESRAGSAEAIESLRPGEQECGF